MKLIQFGPHEMYVPCVRYSVFYVPLRAACVKGLQTVTVYRTKMASYKYILRLHSSGYEVLPASRRYLTFSILKMDVIYSSETLNDFHRITCPYIPEDRTLYYTTLR
jgi:hypothetical protein